MKGYEQLEFEETRNLGNINIYDDLNAKCLDSVGNEIKIGDYVVAVSGEAREKCLEGIVVEIFSDSMSCDITVSTYGGKIIEHHGNPLFYEVIAK